MKKFLSLVLALVMTMSLVTISAGAKDFTDDSKIAYSEAVDVMSAVKVIDGYTDGSFNPSATLTRGAAAKIICNLILGPTTAGSLKADAAPYKDVPADSTFAGYIAYCQKEGIISGYADGTFKPGNSLTGYAFMKMLLGALGYDKAIEGYEGANWSINVAKRALNIGLDKGLSEDFNGVKAVTREEACLFALNTLKADMVKYENNATITVGDVVINSNSKAETVTCATGSGNDGNIGSADGEVQFAEKYFGKLKMDADETDAFGRPATKWTYKTESVGTYADKSDLVASYTDGVEKGDLYTLVGKTVVEHLENNPADLHVYGNGAKTAISVKADVQKYFLKDSSGDADGTDKGVLTEVYVDSDTNETTIISINTYVIQASADYDSKKETVTFTVPGNAPGTYSSSKLSLDDFDIADVKEDDYLLVTAAKSGTKYVIKSVTPAETVKGTVETYTTDKNVTIGGTKYSYNKTATTSGFSVGDEAILVLDTYGYIIYVDEDVVADNYVFLRDSKSPNGLDTKYVGAAYFLDGTYDEITLKKVGSNSTPANMSGWYTYSKNTEGKYTLSVLDTTEYTTPAPVTLAIGTDVIKGGKINFYPTLGLKANEKTVVLVRDSDNDVTVYTGVNKIPDITTVSGTATMTYVTKASDGYVKFAFIDLATDPTAKVNDKSTSTDDYMLVLKKPGKKVNVTNDKGYMEVEVLRNGEVVKVKLEKSCTDITKNEVGVLFNKVKTNSDGYITSATKVGPAADKKVDTNKTGGILYSGGALTLGSDELMVGEKTTITLVVGKSVANLLGDPDADYEVSTDISGKYLSNIVAAANTYDYYAILDDDNSSTIETLYVYVKG